MAGFVMRLQLLFGLIPLFSVIYAGVVQAQSAAFDNPRSVCQGLAGEGFKVGDWGRGAEGFEGTRFTAYSCLSEPDVVPGNTASGFLTTLNFFAEGRTADRVEIVKLVLNIHDRKTREAGRSKFLAASRALFRTLGIAPSSEITTALEQGHAGDFAAAFGRIRFEVWTVPVERQRLTIESKTALRQ
jgi:Family of unknown function (DUF6030)